MSGRSHSKLQRFIFSGFFCLAVALFQVRESVAQVPPSNDLEKAISFLQQIDPAKVKLDDQEKVAKEINAAWSTIQKAGPAGSARLKQEITRPGQSDYFRLNGAALVWAIGGLGEAEFIAGVWRRTRLSAQSNYVFYTAFHAAIQQDPRALPMLNTVLANDEFQIYVGLHAMRVTWPLTMDFIWGAYGPKGLAELQKTIDSADHDVATRSALRLLSKSQYLPAYERTKVLATTRSGPVKYSAVQALGLYGHPDDFEFLMSGLSSKDPAEVWAHLFALYEFEDLRAVPEIIPFLQSTDQAIRWEALSVLRHLMTPASFAALRKHATSAASQEERERVDRVVTLFFERMKLQPRGYDRMSTTEKERLTASYRQLYEDEDQLQRGERPMTRAAFRAAALRWREKGRLQSADGDSIAVREILSAATADDIELLLDVRAKVYRRLSDECLYEVERIDNAVKFLGRSRYRTIPASTVKAELKKK